MLWAIFTTFVFEKEIIALILSNGLIAWLYKTKPKIYSLPAFYLFLFSLQANVGIVPLLYTGSSPTSYTNLKPIMLES